MPLFSFRLLATNTRNQIRCFCSLPPRPIFALKAVAHLDGKHVVFGEVQSGIKVLDRMKSVTLLEPKREGKPAPEQRVGCSCHGLPLPSPCLSPSPCPFLSDTNTSTRSHCAAAFEWVCLHLSTEAVRVSLHVCLAFVPLSCLFWHARLHSCPCAQGGCLDICTLWREVLARL